MRKGMEIGLFVGLTALDQGVKLLTAHRTAVLIPGILRLNYTENRGFSLGLFDGAMLPAILISLVIFAGLAAVLIRLPRTSPLRVPLICMCAGALGNLIDRVFLGYVRDMFELLFVRFYVFNPADMYVTLGAAACAVLLLKADRKERA